MIIESFTYISNRSYLLNCKQERLSWDMAVKTGNKYSKILFSVTRIEYLAHNSLLLNNAADRSICIHSDFSVRDGHWCWRFSVSASFSSVVMSVFAITGGGYSTLLPKSRSEAPNQVLIAGFFQHCMSRAVLDLFLFIAQPIYLPSPHCFPQHLKLSLSLLWAFKLP